VEDDCNADRVQVACATHSEGLLVSKEMGRVGVQREVERSAEDEMPADNAMRSPLTSAAPAASLEQHRKHESGGNQ